MTQTQRFYMKLMLTLPKLLKYYKNQYGIDLTNIVILWVIYNCHLHGNEAKRADIESVLPIITRAIKERLSKLKRENFIYGNFYYALTDKGRRVVKSLNQKVLNYITEIEAQSVNLSFAEYNRGSMRKATYNYKIKNGLIKRPYSILKKRRTTRTRFMNLPNAKVDFPMAEEYLKRKKK